MPRKLGRNLDQNLDTLDLFIAHRRQLVDYASGIVGDPARAEDVVQEAYIRFSEASDKPGAIDSPVSYLYRIVRNLAIDWTRRRTVEDISVEPEEFGRIPAPAPTAEQALLYRDELRLLAAALDELPVRTREIFLMHRLQGRTLQDIADHYGISVVRVHQLVRQAMVHGTKRLSEADE